jgi:biopolymer transport protein ExbB
MTMVGSEWVMWILVGLSVICVAMILERMRVIRNQENLGAKLWRDHIDPLMADPQKNELKSKASEIAHTYPCVEGQLLELIEKNPMSRNDLQLVIQSFLGREKLKLEKHLAFLGTIGSNAPFIGLFGTVLGIIKAFHDLGAKVESAGAQSVNIGLSEALSVSWSRSRQFFFTTTFREKLKASLVDQNLSVISFSA